jgi:hypothetical protein
MIFLLLANVTKELRMENPLLGGVPVGWGGYNCRYPQPITPNIPLDLFTNTRLIKAIDLRRS